MAAAAEDGQNWLGSSDRRGYNLGMEPEIPKRMQRLPLYRGMPVPYVQYVGADGTPDFKVIDDAKKREVLQDRLCALCGEPLEHLIAFIGGEQTIHNRMFTDPGMHGECARYAARICPYLCQDDRGYSAADPKHAGEDGLVVREYELIDRQGVPARMGILYTTDYQPVLIRGHGPMIYIKAGEPIWIDWESMPETKKHV